MKSLFRILLAICLPGFCIAQKDGKLLTTESFRGLWILDKFQIPDSATGYWKIDSARNGMTGYILYDGLKYMTVYETKPSSNPPFIFSYTAQYRINGPTIEHKIISASDPQTIGKTLIRDYYLNDDTLFLTTGTIPNGTRTRICWIKKQNNHE
jgi:hypothetical protein